MPKTPAQQMSAALKAVLGPALKTAGFSGSFPRYRRHRHDTPEVLHFISVQYDKAGTAFFLEFGAHPPGDKMTSWGELVPQDKLLLEHVLFTERARLQRRVGHGSLAQDWFSYEGFGDDAAAYRVLAASVAGMLPEIEAWLVKGEAGLHVSPCGMSPA